MTPASSVQIWLELLSVIYGKFLRKKWIAIKKITKAEVKYLISNGVKYGDGGISRPESKHCKTRQLCETKFNMSLLAEYRKDK